jgi:hypothetical protein
LNYLRLRAGRCARGGGRHAAYFFGFLLPTHPTLHALSVLRVVLYADRRGVLVLLLLTTGSEAA